MTHVSTLAVGVLLAASVSACDTGPDPAQRAKAALDAHYLHDVNVTYDKDSNAIHLIGSVHSLSVKQRAEQVAAKAVGSSGSVLNELMVKGATESPANDPDGTIHDRLNQLVA